MQATESFIELAKKYLDLFNLKDPDGATTKMIAAGEEYYGQPYFYADKTGVYMVGGLRNVVGVSPNFGILLSGPIILSANPDQINIGGGYFKFNPMLLSMVPSTTPTPVPTLVKSVPALVKGKLELKSMLSGFESLMGLGA